MLSNIIGFQWELEDNEIISKMYPSLAVNSETYIVRITKEYYSHEIYSVQYNIGHARMFCVDGVICIG